jgi:lectin, mannose-binding 2
LKLELQYKSEDEWTKCFEIENFKVPPVAYLGFSAETGELSDNHDIITVRTQNLYMKNPGQGSRPSAPNASGGKAGSFMVREKKSSSSWTWFFMKFIFFGLALTGGYVGFTIYRTRQRDRF